MKPAYYNEHDKRAAEWLRELIRRGHIAPGDVDERSIEDVRPDDLRGYAQCHFFAGIGVWSYALRRAGVPDSARVWTGSCPCQPFSAAGKGGGFADERHLWPAWFHLITQAAGDARIYGEQVASKDGLAWLDLVHADMEAAGYAFGAVDLCAAGVGAPHIRQRLFFVADTDGGQQHQPEGADRAADERPATGRPEFRASGRGAVGFVADHDGRRFERIGGGGETGVAERGDAFVLAEHRAPVVDAFGPGLALSLGHPGVPGGTSGTDARQAFERAGVHAAGLADNYLGRQQREGLPAQRSDGRSQPMPSGGGEVGEHDGATAAGRGASGDGNERPGPTNGLWRAADWIACRDERWRPVEPGTFPLAHGAPARVGRLRGYGNAINAEVATEFIRATL